MINVSLKIKENSQEVYAAVDSKMDMLAGIPERAALLSRGFIIAHLVNALGEAKAKHFDVSVMPGPFGMAVVVTGLDEISNFIVDGTSAHNITVGNGSAMPVAQGVFATSVSHPGTEGDGEAIRQAVLTGAAEGFTTAVTYG